MCLIVFHGSTYRVLIVIAFFRNAGIRTERVNGWSKGFTYTEGMKFTGSDPNHAWNAVYLNENWWLLDPTWGAGYVDDNKNFIQQYSEHYFLTDPKQFIYDHFPEDTNWQLLEKMVPISVYQNYVRLTKHFFRLKMKPFSHRDGVVLCDTGKLHFKFRLDKDVPVKCSGKLTEENGDPAGNNEHYIHVYSTEKTLHVLVDVPHEGNFRLKLFARDINKEIMETLPLICTYMVKCTGKLGKASSFPRQFRKWSPGFFLHSPTDGVLCNGETYKFRITLPGVTDMAVCLGKRIIFAFCF